MNENEENKPAERSAVHTLAERVEQAAQRAAERKNVKVTAEQVLAGSQHTTSSIRRRFSWPVVITTAGLLGAVGISLTTVSAVESAAIKASQENEVIREIEADLASRERELVEVADPDTVVDALDTAREAAEQVAALQNQHTELLMGSSEPVDGAPGEGFLASVEHRRELEPYFAESTWVLPADEAYTPTSVYAMNPGDIDPRLPWYQRRSDAGAWQWQTVSVSPVPGTVGMVSVVWLAHGHDETELLAWAEAIWDAQHDQFVSLMVGTTALGDAQDATTMWLETNEDLFTNLLTEEDA